MTLEELHSTLHTGNLDPKEVELAKEGQKRDFPNGIAECGADALRFTLLSCDIKNTHSDFDVRLCEYNKRFCNKIWQSFKFMLSKAGDKYYDIDVNVLQSVTDATDCWLLSRMSAVVEACDQGFHSYNFHHVAEALHQFWYHDFCDIYLVSINLLKGHLVL